MKKAVRPAEHEAPPASDALYREECKRMLDGISSTKALRLIYR